MNEIESLKKQLEQKKAHLLNLEERKVEFVDARSVPLDFAITEDTLRQEIAELERRLEAVQGKTPAGNNAPVTKSDVLCVLYGAHRREPDEWVPSEQVRQELGLAQEQLYDFIIALREKGFLEAKFSGDRALLRITFDGVAVSK